MDDLFSAFDGTEQLPPSPSPSKPKPKPKPKPTPNKPTPTPCKSSVPVSVPKRPDPPKTGSSSGSIEPVCKKAKTGDDAVVVGSKAKVEKGPAKEYPFELDVFQKESIRHIENNESVLVAAHTSAGKTAVAEYAIALALREKQRVIYTSPIKALSNQKYRDLSEEFSDVGLMTGDVTLNPNASCLVMTTEILRSMLYRGSEVIREVAWTIFDEVHYMRDRERGVVWEESIILLPHKVRYVFLSATIPNAKQFAQWITKVHHQPCHVVYTEFRPTPLQHYMFPAGGQGVFMIVDEKGKFRDDNLQRAMSQLSKSSLQEEVLQGEGGGGKEGKRRGRRRQDKKADLSRLIQMVIERKYDPVIVFSFSKKDCEVYAKRVSRFGLNSEDEGKLVARIFENAIDSLNDDDKKLPQVVNVLPFLKRGIGIHHGGLLPIIKEIVEILFGEGLLKVLFATETFAMGINMPAKTVIFTAIRKFDGTDFRLVGSGEYIQMSGRAGRRGLDERGIVIQMVDEAIEPDVAKTILNGQANPLASTFHLGYNMLLNLMRVEDADPEFIIRNSLFAFQQEQVLPRLNQQLEDLRKEVSGIELDPNMEASFVQYHNLVVQMERVRAEIRDKLIKPKHILCFLSPGRLVRVAHETNSSWWGVLTSYRVEEKTVVKEGMSTTTEYTVVDVALACDPSNIDSPATFAPSGRFDAAAVVRIMPFALAKVDGVSTICIHVPKKVRSAQGKKGLMNAVNEVLVRFKDGVPLLDPVEDMNIKDPELPVLIARAEKLQTRLKQDKIQTMPSEERDSVYSRYLEKHNLESQVKLLQKEIKTVQTLPLKDKLKRMKIVLRTLGHVDKDNVIQLKGRVACEVSTANELVVTELVLSGAFNDMDPAVAAAMLVCVVYTEKGDEDIKVPAELEGALQTLQKAAKKVGETERDAKIEVDPEEFVAQFRADLMEAVYRWCKGASFREICNLTSCFEGTTIRCIRRLVELLRQLCVAAKVIGDRSLEDMFKQSIKLIKRDIIFAGSLYL